MATASHAHDSVAAERGRCVCAGEIPTRIDGTDRPHDVPIEARQEVAEAAAPERARPISQRNGAACGYARERRSSRARLPARAIYPMCSLPKYRGRHSEYPRGHSPVTHSLTHSTSQNYARLNASRWFVGCGLNPGSGALTSTSCLVLPNALPTSRSPASAPSHPAAHPAPTCDRTARCAHRPACVAQASLHLRMTCDEPSDGVSAGKRPSGGSAGAYAAG